MIPEIGQFALIRALILAVCQGVLPLIGAHRNDAALMSVARTATFGQLFFCCDIFRVSDHRIFERRFLGTVRRQSLAACAADAL